MNYTSSDFDNLNAGINILNIEETITELIPYEGSYSDKGKGYKQQYAVLGAYNIADISRLQIDFCFIFKDGFTPQNVTNLNSNGNLITLTPTITSDNDGNVVWLYENADTWYDLLEFYGGDISYIRWYVNDIEYSYYIRSNSAIDNKQPDEFDVIFYDVTNTNLSFEANRYSPTSSELEIKFDGTFYNGSLGLVNNSIQDIIIYHFDDNDNQVIDKTLVNNTDYTIDGNRVYSGTSTQVRPIVVNTGILYNQKKEIFIMVETIAINTPRSYLIPKGIPVCNWKEGKFYVNGDLYVADEDGENEKNVMNEINVINSDRQYVTFIGQDDIQSTSEQTVVSTTLNKGMYLITCDLVLNYYGQSGRELETKMYLNNVICHYTTGTINTYAWALTRTIVAIVTVSSDNSSLELKTKSSTTSRYDYGASGLNILRLK